MSFDGKRVDVKLQGDKVGSLSSRELHDPWIKNTLFLQKAGESMSSKTGRDRISSRKMPLKPHELPSQLQKWAFRAFKPQSLRGWDLSKVRSLRP